MFHLGFQVPPLVVKKHCIRLLFKKHVLMLLAQLFGF